MAMVLLEEEGDEGLHDELMAALAAAEARRPGGIHQQKQMQQRHYHEIHHPAPPLTHTAPQKKLTITHNLSSSVALDLKDLKPIHSVLPASAVVSPAHNLKYNHAAGKRNETVIAGKAPQMSSMNYNKNARILSGSGAGLDSRPKQEGFITSNNGVGGTCNWSGPGSSDVKPHRYVKTGGRINSGGRGGGEGSDVKQVGFPVNGSSASEAWSGRRPLQELQPWVGSREIVERPSSTSSWVQAENTSCSTKECNVAWFSGFSGVAMFKECQDAALRTLVPSDYTMMCGKPFIKKTDPGASLIPGALVIEGKRDSASQITTFLAQLKQGPKPGHAKTY